MREFPYFDCDERILENLCCLQNFAQSVEFNSSPLYYLKKIFRNTKERHISNIEIKNEKKWT